MYIVAVKARCWFNNELRYEYGFFLAEDWDDLGCQIDEYFGEECDKIEVQWFEESRFINIRDEATFEKIKKEMY